MRINCAWCKTPMGVKEPLEDTRVTHSICDACALQEVVEKTKHKPTYGTLTILEIQQGILDAGWVWQETMYQDGQAGVCLIVFTKSTDPYYFTKNPLGDKGWGRFSREYAWRAAYDSIVLGLTSVW